MGFLSSLLPMAAGAASTYFTGNPYLGMALAGGVTAQKTGSLQQGMLAGLSAYGGGQLASGLQAAGTAQASGAIGQSAAAAGEEAAQEAIRSAGPKMIGADLEQMGAAQAAKANMLSPEVIGQSAREAAANAYTPTAAQTAALNSPMQTGLSSLGSKQGWSSLAGQMGGAKGVGMAGLAATAPMLMQQPEQPQTQPGDSTMPQRLKYEQGTATPFPMPDVPGYGDLGQDFGRQRSYFPGAGYKQITDEEAKSIRGYAAGGLPVEQMSKQNAIGMNTGYPQADVTGHAYATPWQTPVSTNVVSGTADTGVNRMTGQMLAGGGITGEGNLDLHIPLDFGQGGGFGGASANGYKAAGSGSSGSQSNFLGLNNTSSSGLDQRAVAANPQGFQQFLQQAQQREQQYPGSTMFAGLNGGKAQKQTYEQYLAGQNPLNHVVPLTREQFENPTPSAAMSSPNYFFAAGGLNMAGKYSRDLPGDLENTYAKAERTDNKAVMRGVKQEQGLRERLRNPQMYAGGGLSDLGGYSDGGRLLKGPGDGVSDSIPAVIGHKQPARLADGEFVVPARIVSELGNGSTEAGARKLYAMMDRVQKARGKTVGKGKVAKNSRADRYLPA